MNQAEEKALKALNDATEENLMQDLTCETPEEEQARASEIDKLVASVEAKQEDLAREQRSAAALAKVESVKSQVTKTGLVRSTPEKKTEIRAADKKKLHRCFEGNYGRTRSWSIRPEHRRHSASCCFSIPTGFCRQHCCLRFWRERNHVPDFHVSTRYGHAL